MSLVSVDPGLKSKSGQLTLPTVFHMHGYPGYCPRLLSMSKQCYGTQKQSLLQTYTSADKQEMAHHAAIESSPSSNGKLNHTCLNKDGPSDQCGDIQKILVPHDLLYSFSSAHQKMVPTVPVQSYDPIKAKIKSISQRWLCN